ncbi:recombinase family protein, partial [Klebsiella pneumoniae]
MKQRMFSYVRWSTPRQASGTSLKRQTARAKEFAEKHNLEMVEIFDRGVSAFAGKHLLPTAALGSFIDAVKQGAIESTAWLYTENLDRLHRGKVTDAQELLLTLINLGITVVAGMDGEKVYTREYLNKNPHELFMTVMVFVRANEESETKRKRVLGNVEALYQDYKNGEKVVVKSVGNHPFWIDDTGPSHEGVKKHPVLWNIAREAIEMFLAGTSVWSVCNHLNEKYPNMYPSSKRIWTTPNVRKLRTNEAVIGKRVIYFKDRDEPNNKEKGKTYTFEDYYPKLCTDDEWSI